MYNSYQQQFPADFDSLDTIKVNSTIDPNAHLTVDDFESGVQTCTIYAKVRGSMMDFGSDAQKAIWSVSTSNNPDMFKRRVFTPEGDHAYEGDLSKGIVLNAKQTMVKNTYPVDIGAHVSGIFPQTFGSNGEYATIISSGTTAPVYMERSIFAPKNTITLGILEKYDSVNFDPNDFVVSNNKLTLVSNSSPIADMMRLNQNAFDPPIQMPPPHVEGWLEIHPDVVTACVEAFDEHKRVNFVDFNNLQVEFARADGKRWDDESHVIGDLIGAHPDEQEWMKASRMEGEYECVLQIDMEYVLYQ